MSTIEAGVIGSKVFVCIITPEPSSHMISVYMNLTLALQSGKEIVVVFHDGGEIP